MSENMKIWEQVAATDPQHTKKFTRAGGFSGTAIRPMSAIEKMTQVFGPCGIGWGYTKPEYTIQPGSDGQILVFCVLCLWYTHDGKKSELIPGVGGDLIVVKQTAGLRSDDEAFKKAFTDALMNAMKHIGMSADVHMGQFDGNKYVQPAPKALEGRMADDPDVQADMKALGYDPKAVYDTVMSELDMCEDSDMLATWVTVNKTTRRMQGLPKELKDDVTASYNKLKEHFTFKQQG